MTTAPGRTRTRLSASFMLVLALVYLMHAALHTASAEVPVHPTGAAVALGLDPFILAEGQTGDGLVGCHFFCNHGCPMPPLALPPSLPETTLVPDFDTPRIPLIRSVRLQPIKAPPRSLA